MIYRKLDTKAFYLTNYSVNYQRNEFTRLAFYSKQKRIPFLIYGRNNLGIHKCNAINSDTVGDGGRGDRTREPFHSNQLCLVDVNS